jgi:hypothetical protein
MACFSTLSLADSARKSFGAGIGEQVAAGQLPPDFFLAVRFGFVGVGFFFIVFRGERWQCQS